MSDLDFRLPKTVRPLRYELGIDVDLDAWQFRGSEEIEVTLAESTGAVTLHAAELEIGAVCAVLADGTRLQGSTALNAIAETATLRFEPALPAGRVRLSVAFRGTILARLRGFYRSQKDGARYAATQFEAADARRAFPCFDEPEFKARFALTLNVPAHLTAIANGAVQQRDAARRRPQGGAASPRRRRSRRTWSRTRSAPTKRRRSAHTPRAGWPVRVFLPRGMAAKGIYARDAHVRSLDYLEEYTAIPYPYGKVDAIGIPDFEAGAMENPGAITYRLTAIAADCERASTPALKGIFYTAAHELTHMWWGDLVTMAWWDDLWLNESFATFIGYKVVADLMPEWGMWRDFVATLVAAVQPRRAGLDPPDLVRGQERQAGDRTLRRHHLLEGRRRGAHDRGLPRRRCVPHRRARLPRALPRAQRDRRRLLARARQRVGARRRHHRQRLDQAARPSAAHLRRAAGEPTLRCGSSASSPTPPPRDDGTRCGRPRW